MNSIEMARCDIERVEAKLTKLVQAQQIHRADFVELCLGLDGVKRALATIAPIEVTGEMLHNAFAKVEPTAQPWEVISHEQVNNYRLMAEYLNDAIKLKQATQEPGYVWSDEESGGSDEA